MANGTLGSSTSVIVSGHSDFTSHGVQGSEHHGCKCERRLMARAIDVIAGTLAAVIIIGQLRRSPDAVQVGAINFRRRRVSDLEQEKNEK